MAVSRHEIREALDESTVRGMQIMQLALTVGVVLFTAFTVGRSIFSPQSAVSGTGPPDAGLLRTLSTANVALLVGAVVFGHLLFRARISSGATDVAAAVAALRAAILLRLALLEGAALFGVAICFLATTSGPPADPAIWLNLVSPAAFVLFSAATFPTRERLASILADGSA